MCPATSYHKLHECIRVHTASAVCLSTHVLKFSLEASEKGGERDTQQENSNTKQAVTYIQGVTGGMCETSG